MLTAGQDRVVWLRRVAGIEDGGEARCCARGQGGAEVLWFSDLIEKVRRRAVNTDQELVRHGDLSVTGAAVARGGRRRGMTGGAGPSGERGVRAGLLALLAGLSMEERRGAGRLLGWMLVWVGFLFYCSLFLFSFSNQLKSN